MKDSRAFFPSSVTARVRNTRPTTTAAARLVFRAPRGSPAPPKRCPGPGVPAGGAVLVAWALGVEAGVVSALFGVHAAAVARGGKVARFAIGVEGRGAGEGRLVGGP